MADLENANHEDIVWKNIFQLFKNDGLKFFGIEDDIISAVNVEQLSIDIQRRINDNLYLTNKNRYLHLEFQSTKTKLTRFMLADAILVDQYDKPVQTIVIYTANIQDAEDKIDKGSLQYSVKNFYMAKFDGDEQFNIIKNKLDNKEPLSRHDIMSMVLIPLMKHKTDIPSMIEQTIDLSTEVEDKDVQQQVQAMLYIFADKFITDMERKLRIKERLAMTAIGQMLIDDGIEKGRQEGILEATLNIVNKALKDGLSADFIANLTGITTEKIEELKKEIKK